MTPKFVRSAAVAFALSSCVGLPPDSPGLPAGAAASESSLSPLCNAQDGTASGNLGFDVLGTWQDWTTGSYKLTTFQPDGSVTIWALHTDGLESAPTIETRGRYTVSGTKLSIVWANGATEQTEGSLESYPGCTMLTLKAHTGLQSRIPSALQLERVKCDHTPTFAVMTEVTK